MKPMFPKFWTMENLSLYACMFRYDTTWLSGTTAVCQWCMKWGITTQCTENTSNATQQVGWIFKVLLKLLYCWSYEQWDSQSKKAQDAISERWRKIHSHRVYLIYKFESHHFNCRHLFFLTTFLFPIGMNAVPDRLFGRLGISLFFYC